MTELRSGVTPGGRRYIVSRIGNSGAVYTYVSEELRSGIPLNATYPTRWTKLTASDGQVEKHVITGVNNWKTVDKGPVLPMGQ